MSYPIPVAVADLQQAHEKFDLTIVVSTGTFPEIFAELSDAIPSATKIDPRVGVSPSLVATSSLPGGRTLYVPIGDISRDYDDVRRFFDLGKTIAALLTDIHSVKPLLSVFVDEVPSYKNNEFNFALQNVYLGICQQLWQPLEARVALDEKVLEPVECVGMFGLDASQVSIISAIEAGKRVARDLCGTEPESMAPIGFVEYCEDAFTDTNIGMHCIDDENIMLQEYPCLHAVARASLEVARHHPRILTLSYDSEDEIQQTLFLAGKGITFDTGGADLKVNGHMAGMSRDKGGAAAVAGFMKTLSMLKPKGLKVVATLALVRNSVGADAYVPDEIITSHAGIRVRVGNTDAEGRMVLTDVLSHMREQAIDAINPQIFSVATLTGHAAIAFGPYTALLENQVAISQSVSQGLIDAGHLWSDPCEQSRVRREDYDFIQPRTKADDVLSSNNAPSVSTVRGHQFPMAYLSIASGLDAHNMGSDKPIAYTHVDIAGSGVENLNWQHGKPTAAPLAAFTARYILPRL
ncbi:leucyl aminopeptidase family protein [Glaciecola sp. XM2]|jgi:leucyl aminopeptidase|uniref:M17 family metallopeptidase n=1 Tax=Glaciecola sp. XM2 TaxID=1914931 RepID=UPI001BDF2DBB|nr:leucyl aminopeptidase family protein [Glaciecola sp. XM2]MBT1451104.1 leucyl aminopeptidase family protein [Glaciecola sp. XM2]